MNAKTRDKRARCHAITKEKLALELIEAGKRLKKNPKWWKKDTTGILAWGIAEKRAKKEQAKAERAKIRDANKPPKKESSPKVAKAPSAPRDVTRSFYTAPGKYCGGYLDSSPLRLKQNLN